MNNLIGVDIAPATLIVNKPKSAGSVFERSLIEIIKKTTVVDYKTSINKKLYFDVVDVLMHIIRGIASELPANETFKVGRSHILQAATIMNSFYSKEMSIDVAIESSFQAGKMFVKSIDPKMVVK